MSELCFLLSYPEHRLSKFNGAESWQLVFQNARLTKGIGKLPISYESRYDEHTPSNWQTLDVADEDAGNVVHLFLGGTQPDTVRVERPPCLRVLITLSPETFSRFLTINWREKFVLLEISLKYPASIPEKLPIVPLGKEPELPIGSYYIKWDEGPAYPQHYLNIPSPPHSATRWLYRILGWQP